ncbi:HAD-IA family hydrolase [Paucibacter sp. R3-3]|uniref:HAD-IA family hydrolase n=1 Tax=Roseateles agri TaxID=3098619 RepID=A0ABU5DD74_9BURK|nr:HAD-IA family hydrolase [Paucibacter sp. R3-3]MDY0744220.1 HAD-IA family hydrolase [Paucibacter sp. R3-3]
MSRPQQFDLIAFDWDGTLFDSTALITRSIQNAAVDLGLPRPSDEAASYVIGMALYPALAHAVPELPPERYKEMGLRYRHHYLGAQHEVTLFDGTEAMLAALKARHHWLTVATGKNRRGLDEVLQVSGLAAMFDGTRTADETQGKPHPQMLLELMREFGAEPERTLMIGDTTHDLQMAVNAGCPCVGVSYGAHDHESFAEFKPLFVAHTTAELHQWLIDHA